MKFDFKDVKKLYKKKPVTELLLYTFIIAFGIALDRITKALTVSFLKPVGSFPIIQDVIHFTYATNDGCAFGMLDNAPWIFNTVSIVTVVFVSLYLYLGHSQNRLYSISLSMIAAGGIGNLIDRLSLGYVVDFIDVTIINFAIFNVADCLVCIGAGLVMLALILDIIKEAKEEKQK